MVNERDARIQLAFAGMHPDRRQRLIAEYGGAAHVVRAMVRGRIDMPPEAKTAVAISASDRIGPLTEAGISVIQRDDDAYPARLATITNPPDVLFVRGEIPDGPVVAMVGTRRATAYGLRLAEAFGCAVGAAGYVVASGLAKGIDGAAHRGLVAAGGRGVAVLGSGIDVWYPRVNARLGEQVLASGAVVSEYPPGTRPAPWRFPPRNRIIAGMSEVVLVVEAGMPGGAMITARLACDEHRDVFAVPGDIGRTASVGCNLLIRDGAWPVLGADDLVEAVERVTGVPAAGSRARSVSVIIDACSGSGSSIDELADATGWSAADVLAEVAKLEIEGAVLYNEGMVMAT